MKKPRRIPDHCLSKTLLVLAVAILCCGCADDYVYDDIEPDFLGESIYDYLSEDGNFTTYLRIVDDLDYKDVLSLTGSKTVFPADDEAFARFFASNQYGVTEYSQLTRAQKRSLLNASMINMSYLTGMLSNATLSGENTALRRACSSTYLDSISFITDDVQLSAPYWTRFRGRGLYLADDETSPYIVHFTPGHTGANNIAESDLSLVLGTQYSADDVYVNGVRVKNPDIYCKNGYIHVVEDVLTPAPNMSQVIGSDSRTGVFNKLLNRYSAPFFSYTTNDEAHALYDGTSPGYSLITDSVFCKRYFTESSPSDPDGNDMTSYGLLYFDPSNNDYGGDMTDMGVMFVPTDEALESYINGTKGRYLKDSYGSWDNIPSDLVALFVKNHQKKSFMSSLPSSWPTMNDEESFLMGVKESDIEDTYIAGNGIVYVTNQVYPPVDYQCVYGPVLTNDGARIMKWALLDSEMKFYLYLRSMENMYNLLVPTDEALENYRDPVAWAKGKSSREIWAFKYDETNDNPVSADVYYVTDEGEKGTLKRTVTDMSVLRNRLNDICDRHIVVGDMDSEGNMSGYLDAGDREYFQTKGGSTIRVAGSGNNMTVTGGGDTEQGTPGAVLVKTQAGETEVYDSDNGRTYFIDRVVQDPTSSVYTNLGSHEEFSSFFELLGGNDQVFTLFKNDSEINSIFSLNRTSTTSGLGQVVSSFNNYNYTVFVPTNEAVSEAFARDSGLHTWDEIAAATDIDVQRQWALHLIRFLKYHFMDNSVYIGKGSAPEGTFNYETAARNDAGRFQKLSVTGDGENFTITDSLGGTAHVVKTEGLYDLQSRDFIVNSDDYTTATEIVSSSVSVIHLIDRALMPE